MLNPLLARWQQLRHRLFSSPPGATRSPLQLLLAMAILAGLFLMLLPVLLLALAIALAMLILAALAPLLKGRRPKIRPNPFHYTRAGSRNRHPREKVINPEVGKD
ncbi:hypothetical protein [Ferrimonas pelagia]|uniref:Transmembrane protein (PGPGW) n=1 Tax=Ferrimonas pelagia TaxID=1177826 RepID=A0ABP9FH70_9GAMM